MTEQMSEVIAHPLTGEAIAVKQAPTDLLADIHQQIADAETDLRSRRRAVDDELIGRMDHEGVRTFQTEGFKLEASRPLERVWHIDALRRTLERLVRDEIISQRKADACVRCEFKAVARELRPLETDPRTQKQIAACFVEEPASRYLKVRR